MKAPSILPQGFYVYTHHRADTGEIFYVGKGKDARAWDVNGRSPHWHNIIKKHGLLVRIQKQLMAEYDALALEVALIDIYGRRDKEKGTLINRTDGGEGVSGRVIPKEERIARGESIKNIFIKNPSLREKYGAASRASLARPETKARLSASLKKGYADGKFETKERWRKISESWNTDARQRRIDGIKKSAATPEGKARRSAASKLTAKKTEKKIWCPEINVCFASITDASLYLRENGWPKALTSNICWCCKGKLKVAYGLTWIYCD